MEHLHERQGPPFERFKTFSLQLPDTCLLPTGHGIVVDTLLGLLILVDWQSQQVLAVCNELDEDQFDLVLALLEYWPGYVPYEKLLGLLAIALSSKEQQDLEVVRTSGRHAEVGADELSAAQARESAKPLVQTLRELMGACKPFLHPLGITIVGVLDHGHLLVPYVGGKDKPAPAVEAAR